MAKVDRVIALLESRIRQGDYALRTIPPDGLLAEEVGVSRMTARKAVLHLMDKGLLIRQANGRVAVNSSEGNGDRVMQVGFLVPGEISPEIQRWRSAVELAATRQKARVRTITFYHWDDPAVLDASTKLDGLFLVPPAERIPSPIAERLRNGRARVVALDADLSEHGIRSVDLVRPSSVQALLDHLAGLGHRKIACLNTQPLDAVVAERIGQWDLWRAAQNIEGTLIDEPEPSYGRPIERALAVVGACLDAGTLDATALLGITLPAAMGAMRAMYQRGLTPGKDLSVCAANDEGLAAYLCPSLTAVQMPDPLPYLTVAMEWMAGKQLIGPLLSRPDDVSLFVGESTGRPRVRE